MYVLIIQSITNYYYKLLFIIVPMYLTERERAPHAPSHSFPAVRQVYSVSNGYTVFQSLFISTTTHPFSPASSSALSSRPTCESLS